MHGHVFLMALHFAMAVIIINTLEFAAKIGIDQNNNVRNKNKNNSS